MALEGFLAENFWYVFLAVFLAGTALLMKTRAQRTFIIFLIRTKKGINWLDRLGSISPGFWKFLGDLAVIVSFGGLGALYVCKYRKVWPFLTILGALALMLLAPLIGIQNSGMLFLLLLIALFFINRADKPESKSRKFVKCAYFILAAAIMFSALLGFTGTIRPGIPSYAMSALTGIFGLPGLLVSALSFQASSILLQESALPGVSPLLPGMNQEGQIGFIFPGLDIFIPLWSGLLAIIILLVSHEFSHGIMARVQGIKVKNMGLLTFGIIPIGAFVEPDEKFLEKRKSEEKMRVYSMGSFANLIVAALAAMLLVAVSFPLAGMVEPVGIEIVSVQEGFPAEVLEPGTVVQKINGVEVKTVPEYINESGKSKPGDIITLETDKGVFKLKSIQNPQDPEAAHLGVNLRAKVSLKPGLESQQSFFSLLLALGAALEIIFFLNLNIAIVNLLPIVPFDGFRMFDELLKSFNISGRKRKKVIKWVLMLVLLLLILNALPLGNVFLSYFGGA